MILLNHIIRIFVGLVFIISGLAKLYPIEPFEIIFVDLGISNFLWAPFLARFIIGFELFLGFSILFNTWLKDIVYKLALISLLIFSAYLIFLLVTVGNQVDCGCFGSFLELNPIESILKNVLLIVLLLFIKRRYHNGGVFLLLPIVFFVLCISSTFLLNRVGLHSLQGIEVNEKVDYSKLPKVYQNNEKVDFSEGKKMIAFFSNSCPHCINASRIFASIGKGTTINNLYYVVGAKTDGSLNEFLDISENTFPVLWINDDEFFKYSGGRLPAIVYLEDGVIKKKWFGDLFDVDEVKSYLE
jgi:glutaredoxin